jgi:hypothetical protein
MTVHDQHVTALPDRLHGDYEERCAINRGDGPLTDEIRERAFLEVIKAWGRELTRKE